MKSPLVSVIIPTYNRPTFLKKAIDSVANQTYTNIEIIVIDDGSNNNYALEFCNKHENCNYFYKNNGGLSSARNFGFMKSHGEFIAFLDDDDFWKEDKIEKQVNLLLIEKDIDLIHSSAFVVDEEGELTGEFIGAASNKIHKRSGNVFWNALGVWVVKSPTPLIRKKVFKSDLMFDESIKVGEDLDFYQRLFYRHKVLYIEEPLAFYRTYNDDKRLSCQKEKYIGIELKMITNFKDMGISNPILLHRIAIRLLKQALNNWNSVYILNKIKLSNFNLYMRPLHCLNNYFNK
ncbi:MAG: hypothetical protein DRI75_09155 [Bacteroidetes bacterium]|nr:MAG: hypothetical protein DRI75_09155 [Bacteroidota bacterium]